MGMDMTFKTLPALRLATIPHSGPYQQIGPVFRKLGDIAGPAGLFARTTGRMMGLYKDDPRTTPPNELRSAAALPISEGEVLPAGLIEERLDGGRFASFLHVGPYEGLPAAWAEAVATFLSSGHRRRNGPSLEIYVNDPSQVSPDALQTEIAIPME
jgi:AraC family transcriptional regulator